MSGLLRDVQGKWYDIASALISRKMSITAMESCTSGLIASLITDTEGASSIQIKKSTPSDSLNQ